MSASEKLKARERKMRDLRFHTETKDEAQRDVLHALPQFIALAEAAEWVSESGVYSYERHETLTNALAALEDALQ